MTDKDIDLAQWIIAIAGAVWIGAILYSTIKEKVLAFFREQEVENLRWEKHRKKDMVRKLRAIQQQANVIPFTRKKASATVIGG